MATQLFMTNANGTASTPYNFHSGAAGTLVGGSTTIFNQPKQLHTSRGSGVVSSAARATATGPSAGLDYSANPGDPFQWVSAPIDADVTISGTVTFNIWGSENSMSANCGPQVLIQRVTSTGTATTIVNSEEGVEYGTSASAHNWTASPTSTACLRGDRIRVVVGFNDAGGTMASGFTSTLRFSGTTGAADGDTYISFNETFGFLTTDPTTTTIYPTNTDVSVLALDTGWVDGGTAADVGLGDVAWTDPSNAVVLNSAVAFVINAAGGDTNRLDIQTFGFSFPAGSSILGLALQVWVAAAIDGTMNVQLLNGSGTPFGSARQTGINAGAGSYDLVGSGLGDMWGAALDEATVEDTQFGVRIYFTNPADENEYSVDNVQIKVFYGPPGMGRPREVWTSRGAGVQTDVTTSVTGPTAPRQMTDLAAGLNVDWYTKPLVAFTLAAPVLLNVRVKQETSDFGNYAPRCEISVCDGDGTGAVAWGSNQHGQEITTTETAYVFYISGDDVAVTDGQRLLIRFYIDDAWGTMVGGSPCTLYYAGTSGGASGDTYLILDQALTEFVSDVSLYAGAWYEPIDLQIAE